ncbi:MAG TPA: hypothetical protein VFB66_18675 [Tepidisphaeraceae bacterium]|nr:hypothetical protein [Tepidisphaeraceae bacterium]
MRDLVGQGFSDGFAPVGTGAPTSWPQRAQYRALAGTAAEHLLHGVLLILT